MRPALTEAPRGGRLRTGLLLAGLVLGLALLALWATGGLGWLEHQAQQALRRFQTALAAAIRALRGGEPGALAALLGVAFGYGFLHAVGPGHGKFVIGAYGVGRRVRLVPLAAIAVAASLAQATVAVALVHGGLWLFGWTRAQVQEVTDTTLAPLGHAAVALVGLWLVWRGGRALLSRRTLAQEDHAHQHHDHHHAGACSVCGHRHGPTPDELAALSGWRDALLLIGGIALRPCSGALFLLILTWQMGIAAAGIAGAYAMGLGTAMVTLTVAGLSVWAREGALAALPRARTARALLPAVELAAGALIAATALALLASAG